MWQILLLGPLEVKHDGQQVRVPGGKASELLIRLALEAGQEVPADRLLNDLWQRGLVATRRNTLQSKVTMLRRAFTDPDAIRSGVGGYALVVEPLEVDAFTVVEAVTEATRLLEAGDDPAAANLSVSSLNLFHGELLQNAGDGDWALPHRSRLQEARLRLIEIEAIAQLRLGDVSQVIGKLEAAVATYPFQEALQELLITALYRAGRHADALAAYQRAKNQLADELGLDPRPELRQLEQQILIQDAALGAAFSTPEPVSPQPSRGNVPSMTVELVGRSVQVTDLARILATRRLVEIVGPGGVGKTALAIATAQRLTTGDAVGTGGIWLARLETAATPADVVDVMIAAMQAPGGEAAVFERLKGASALVILDNCEHVLDAAAELATRLLDASAGLRVLCTSQVPLGVNGETLFELAPLALPDAVELFTKRAAAQRLIATSSRGDDAVLELCRALDGLPLAIELAAARTKTLSVEDINERLIDRFQVLSDPTSRRPERRRSLKSTIRWSYELLFPDDKRGLWALAVFAGGARLPAVECILQALDVPADAAIDVVGRLASRSLVIVDDQVTVTPLSTRPTQATSHSIRYRLLDSIRVFALQEMADAQQLERALAAHARWFAEVAKDSTRGVRSHQQSASLDVARMERANIDAALQWAATNDPLLGLSIVNGFGWAWVVLGDSRGAQRISTALRSAGDMAPARDRASALLLAAWIEASTDDLARAQEHIASAAHLANAVGDARLRARCCYYLAYVVSHQGKFREALTLTEQSSAILDELDEPWDQAATWLFAARAAISAGDHRRAVGAIGKVGHWVGQVDDPWLHVRRDAILGELARIEHRFDDAVLLLRRAAETSRTLGFQQTEAYQVASLGRAQCLAGDYAAGSATLQLAVDKALGTGDVRLAALTRVHLGRVMRAVGDEPGARAALELAQAWHRKAGGGEQAALGECLLAAMDSADGDPSAAERLTALYDEARHNDDGDVEVLALDALARSVADDGDMARARDLSATADQRMAVASHFVTGDDRVDRRWVRELVIRDYDGLGRPGVG